MTLTVGSLFSGIGGLDLGLERAGMTVVWQSEIDPYCCRVLAKHWPDVPNLGDVTLIDWNEVPRVDLICGGYPCQPFSLAGRLMGENDPRHLWPYMRDAVRVLRPGYVLTENVAGHLGLGFDQVLSDLAGLGFDADWSLVSACSVGAPHLRRRLFCLAHARDERRQRRWPHAASARPGDLAARQPQGRDQGPPWVAIPPSDLRGVAHGVPHRVDRLRALGNSVVPQVAEHIGRLIINALTRQEAS